MGVSQMTTQMMNENPMLGYMNEIVFTRILGHDDTQEGHYWIDTNQCLYCERWNLITITYHPMNDKKYF